MSVLVASWPPRRNTSRKRGPPGGAAYSRPAAPRLASVPPASLSQRRRLIKLLIVHLRGGEQEGVPLLRRARLVERRAGVGGEERLDGLVVEPVRQLREAIGRRSAGVFGIEQVNVSGADRARNLEATAHLARALPAGSRERIAVGGRPSQRGLAGRLQPIA